MLHRNILFAPSESNSYEFSTFSSVRDALTRYTQSRSSPGGGVQHNEDRAAVEQAISITTLAIQSACSILSVEDIFR